MQNNTSSPQPDEPKFVNPYQGQTDLMRTCFNVPRQQVDYLRSICPRDGLIQNTCAILIEKLIHELKRNNITSFDPETYGRIVAQCNITFAGSGTSAQRSAAIDSPVTNGQATVTDDGRGTTSLARETPPASSVLPNSGKPLNGKARKENKPKRSGKAKVD